MFLVLK